MTTINGLPPVAPGQPEPPHTTAPAKNPNAEAGTTARSAADTPFSSANVSLTQAAVQLSALQGGDASPPMVDNARVNALKQAIDSGSYQIDPARVAEKLLQFENQLHGG